MQILVLQNERVSPAGMIGERIAARGLETVVVKPMDGEPLPASANGYAGILVLGGVMSANDDGKYAALPPMRQLLRDFHAADKPVLGICLGAQVLARTFGASVRRHTGMEFGYTPLRFTDAGRRDPLLAGLPNPQWIMESHEDTFDVPAEGTGLMIGDECLNQAFRVGRASYGFQCHFEATPALIQGWVAGFEQSVRRSLGDRADATFARLAEDNAARAKAQRAFAEAVSDRWLDLL
jgi:GMP synthase (glutamine-hydrolysing)